VDQVAEREPAFALKGDAGALGHSRRRGHFPHQGRIRSAFADPADAAALSRRFSRHGDARLDLEHWERIAVAETVFLSRRPRFKQISEETSDELPGFMEQLQMMTGFSAHKIPGNPFGKRADDD
jgi:hypothetical protein